MWSKTNQNLIFGHILFKIAIKPLSLPVSNESIGFHIMEYNITWYINNILEDLYVNILLSDNSSK